MQCFSSHWSISLIFLSKYLYGECPRFRVTNSCQEPPSLYRENLSCIRCIFTLSHRVNPWVFQSCIRCVLTLSHEVNPRVFHTLLQRFVGECPHFRITNSCQVPFSLHWEPIMIQYMKWWIHVIPPRPYHNY